VSAPTPGAPPELKALMRRLKLGQALDTLPERLALARQGGLGHLEFSYGTACQVPRIACVTADLGRDGPKARRTSKAEQSAGCPRGGGCYVFPGPLWRGGDLAPRSS
jgi:hypothetical protein